MHPKLTSVLLAICSLLSLSGLCCFGAARAGAQGFYATTGNAASEARAGVYIAGPLDVMDAFSLNPAGLSRIVKPVANLSASAVFSRGDFSNSVNTNSPLGTAPGVIPAGGVAFPLPHHLTLAAAEVPELTSSAEWHYNDAPGTAGVSYGYQTNKSTILATRTAGGLSYAPNKSLALGVTVGFDYNSNTLDAPYIFQEQPVLAGLKTLLDLHTTGYGANVSVGGLARVNSRLSFGLSWKSGTSITSTGNATGNLSALFAALSVGAPSTFQYNAEVSNHLPSLTMLNLVWSPASAWTVSAQGERLGWAGAFNQLSVRLTDGTNATVNSLLNSTSLNDAIPLRWHDQYPVRIAVEHGLGEEFVARAGFVHANQPVPASTLLPMTAAIFTSQATVGAGWHYRKSVCDVSYGFTPRSTVNVGQSGLEAGEYSNSRVSVGLQSVTVSEAFVF
jgi:long-subunit fatty acid transport protein